MAAYWAQNDFQTAARSYFNGQFSDFTIICDQKEYNVHRCFIATQSKYFERACDGMFKESVERKIELHDDLPESVDRMVHYFYNFDYDDNESRSRKPVTMDYEEAPVHIQMYCIADKYDIPGLRRLALEKFQDAISYHEAPNPRYLIPATTAMNEVQLPESDTLLRDILVNAWLTSGCATDMATRLPKTFRKLMSETPWLSTAINIPTLSSLKDSHYSEQASSAQCKTQ